MVNKRDFRKMLGLRQAVTESLVCVGLDPLIERIPSSVIDSSSNPTPLATSVFLWMKEIVDATAPYTSMFKPQRAYWEAIPDGINVLRMLIIYIKREYPDIPIFLDCKRGDIGRTQIQYRKAHFDIDGVDGMNYNGYMGDDTLKALVDLEHTERALVGLGRTSNPSAWEIQDITLADGSRLWERMIIDIYRWSRDFGVLKNAGVVMGAAHEWPDRPGTINNEHLLRARTILGSDLWFLIPGIGRQGGFVKETVEASYVNLGSIVINSSSGIIFASSDIDFAKAAAQEAKRLRDEINLYRE